MLSFLLPSDLPSQVFCNTAIESAHADKEVATIKQVHTKDQQAEDY